MSEDMDKQPVATEVKPETAPAEPAAGKTEKKKKHRFLRALLITLLVIVIGAVILLLVIDHIIVGAVRNVAPRVTGTPVELASVRTSILRGHVSLDGFKVGNPKGYQEPYIFELNKFVCDVTPASVFSDKIIIDQVVINGMKFNYEPRLSGGSNLAELQRNIEAFTGADREPAEPATEKPADAEAADQDKPKKQILIRRIVVKDVQMSFSNKMLDTTLVLPLPDITITNDGDGKSMTEALQEFFAELARSAAQAISESGKQLGEGAQKALEDLNATGQKALENVGEEGKKAIENLKEFFSK